MTEPMRRRTVLGLALGGAASLCPCARALGVCLPDPLDSAASPAKPPKRIRRRPDAERVKILLARDCLDPRLQIV
jgi:hypothetical protein